MFESHNSVELKKHSENDSLYCFVVSLSLFLNFFGVCEYSVFSIFPSWLQLNYWFLIIHILMFFFKYFFITSTVDCPILSASKQNFSYYLFWFPYVLYIRYLLRDLFHDLPFPWWLFYWLYQTRLFENTTIGNRIHRHIKNLTTKENQFLFYIIFNIQLGMILNFLMWVLETPSKKTIVTLPKHDS